MSDAEFRRIVGTVLAGPGCRGHALGLTVVSEGNGDVLARYGADQVPTAPPSQSRMLLEDGASAVRCRFEAWRTDAPAACSADVNDLADTLAGLVARHWGDRDPATALPFLKLPTGPSRFAAAARRMATTGQGMAVLHMDLDHFKSVNSEHGEVVGDQALREFADRSREAFQELGVVVRTGGEEFSAVLHAEDPGRLLRAVDGLRRRMEREPLRCIGRPNTCSIGLCIYPDARGFADAGSPDQVLAEARDAERRAKHEGRNRIALHGPAATSAPPAIVTLDDMVETALAARRGAAGPDAGATFREALESLLADIIAQSDDPGAAVAAMRRDFGLLVGSFEAAPSRSPELLGIMGSLSWAGMVMRAMMLASHGHGRPLASADRMALVAAVDGELHLDVSGRRLSLHCAVAPGPERRAQAGPSLFAAGRAPPGGLERWQMPDTPAGHDPRSPVLLMPVGDGARQVVEGLRHLTAAVVEVDDRPTRSGGLPDFWQSNVSRIIQACLRNPNIEAVVAVGDVGCARLTMERLACRGREGLDGLGRRLSIRGDDLQLFLDRQLAVSAVPADRGLVLAEIGQAVAAMSPLDFAVRRAVEPTNRTRRRLPAGPSDQAHRLAVIDGLRTRTLADAYPEALQLLRNASEATDQPEADSVLRELTAFKVVLTEPFEDRVPDFWQEDRAALDGYYDRVFARPDGLIGSRLLRPFGPDCQSLAEYGTSQAAEAALRRWPTRRINLPMVPDTPDQPLGLSSIQVMPRSHGAAAVLDMIFVWRAVDALIGFPFSAYGSIAWAEHLLDAINARLRVCREGPQLRMGTLTYIALSFHMHLHDGDAAIARAVVQECSA